MREFVVQQFIHTPTLFWIIPDGNIREARPASILRDGEAQSVLEKLRRDAIRREAERT